MNEGFKAVLPPLVQELFVRVRLLEMAFAQLPGASDVRFDGFKDDLMRMPIVSEISEEKHEAKVDAAIKRLRNLSHGFSPDTKDS